jgi:hypothetical protein
MAAQRRCANIAPGCAGVGGSRAAGTGCRSRSAARHPTLLVMYRLLRRGHAALARLRSIRWYLCRCSPFLSRPGRETPAHAVVTTGCARPPQRRAWPRLVITSRPESRRLAVAPAGDQVIRWWSRRAAGAPPRSRFGPSESSTPGSAGSPPACQAGRPSWQPCDLLGPIRWRRSRPGMPVVGIRAWPAANRSTATRHCRLPLGNRPRRANLPPRARVADRASFDVARPTTHRVRWALAGEAAGGVAEGLRTPACRTFVTSRQS